MMQNFLSAIDFSSNSTLRYIILGIAVILIIVIVAVSSKSKKKNSEISTTNENVVESKETTVKDTVKQSPVEKTEVKESEKQATAENKPIEHITIKNEKIEKTAEKPVTKETVKEEKKPVIQAQAKAQKTGDIDKNENVKTAEKTPENTETKKKTEQKKENNAKNKVEVKTKAKPELKTEVKPEEKAKPKAKSEPKTETKEKKEKPKQSEDDGVYHKPIIEDFIMELEEENSDKPKVTGKFKVEKVTGFYQFSLYANNGQLLYESREYATEATCKKGVETFKKNIAQSDYRVAADKNGGFKYIYRKGNSIYIGESYSTAKAAENSAKSVKRFAAVSDIVD